MSKYIKITSNDYASLGCNQMSQTHTALYWYERIMKENQIRSVAEIGTGTGALTLLFGLHVNFTLTCDIKDWRTPHIKSKHDNLNIRFLQSDYNNEEIVTFIRGSNRRTFVFCDNGNKEKEFKYFAPIIKPNDVIMVHDVGTEFAPESKENIRCAKENKLERIYKNELDNDCTLLAAWIKK